jgi:hypothetical protein
MESENARRCTICDSRREQLFELRVLGKYQATYGQCINCRFLSSDDPYWLHESFASKLNDLDIGSVDRCLIVADFVESFIRSANSKNGRFLDWGGGYGLLARLMRDRGLDFVSHDVYTHPLFVEPNEGLESDTFELITMSEVALHLTDPVPIFTKILESTNTIIFTAVIAPHVIPKDWWYLMPDTGQHVAIYHKETLETLASQLGVRITTDGRFFHVLHRKRLGIRSRLIIRFRPLAFVVAWVNATVRLAKRGFGKTNSLTPSDQEKLITALPWNRRGN